MMASPRRGRKSGRSSNVSDAQLMTMLMTFRVSELQMLLSFVGQNKTGRKTELQRRAIDILRSRQNPVIQTKIRELYKTIQTGGPGVVPVGTSLDVTPHSSHASHSMTNQMMNSRTMGTPLPGFHPLATRTNLYSSAVSGMYQPTAYAPATGKGPPALPPPALMPQQVPLNPDVTLKRIPFYEIEGELLRPSTLIQNRESRDQGYTFRFYLSPLQADSVSFNREVNAQGKTETYLYQAGKHEIQMRLCACDTSCEQEDAFPPGLAVKVNSKPCPLPPGQVPANKPPSEVKRPPRPINISSLCKLCPSVSNTVHVSWTPDYAREGTFVVGIWVVKRLTALDLLEKLKSKGVRQTEFTAGIIKEKLNEDNDSDIATTSLRVSLICPLGKMRMTTPTRPLTCTHLQCFDATIFLQMNEKKQTWNCPVCNKPALYDNLVIDGYFLDVLTSPNLPQGCHEIQLNKDGSWSSQTSSSNKRSASETPKVSEGIQEINDVDSDDDSLDTGIGSEGGGGAGKTEDGQGGGSAKVILVDLTASDSEEENALVRPKVAAPTEPAKTEVSSTGRRASRASPPIISLDSPSPPPLRDPSPLATSSLLPLQTPSPVIVHSPVLSHSPYMATSLGPPTSSAPAQPTLPPPTSSPMLSPGHSLPHLSPTSQQQQQSLAISPQLGPSTPLAPPSLLPTHGYHPLVHQVTPDHPSNLQQPQFTNYMPYGSRYHPY